MAFFSSFAIFSLSAFSPLFIQGALGRSPFQLGIAMMFLSLGWSVSALVCGSYCNRWGKKFFPVVGGTVLVAGCLMAVQFSERTNPWICSIALGLAGAGMGFTSIATLLIVQNSVGQKDLGVATSSHQFARTFGGTVGIGVCGSLVTARFAHVAKALNASQLQSRVPESVMGLIQLNFENFFRPDIQQQLSVDVKDLLHQTIGNCVIDVFWIALIAAGFSLGFALFLPKEDVADAQ